MTLRKHLQKILANHTNSLQERIKNARRSQRILEKTDIRNAVYSVDAHSLWEDHGGKSITTDHYGSIEDAISKAEKEFKKLNGNSNQVSYSVNIVLGTGKYTVPEKYWKKYVKKS